MIEQLTNFIEERIGNYTPRGLALALLDKYVIEEKTQYLEDMRQLAEEAHRLVDEEINRKWWKIW